ncbi:hypothetical protein AB0J63_42400 [Streptosporangium canum]|uniref:hypothetical protein n=1 Tax=Streptosporangium canum TaxID=324952 RepID=UPI003429D0B0
MFALEELCVRLVEHQVPLTEAMRAQIAVLSESEASWERCKDWGEPRGLLADCAGADEHDPPVRLVEDTEHGHALEDQIKAGIGPGHPLGGSDSLAAWIACCRCDDVLVRVFDYERVNHVFADRYAIVRSPRHVTLFETGFEAIDALAEGCMAR